MKIISTTLLALASLVAPAAQPAFDVEVTDAWIRWLPSELPGAAYMTLINKESVAVAFVGASSPDYGQITLHQTRTDRGVSGMVPLESVTLAANTSVDFAARGYHLMLTQSRRPLHSSDRVPITLRFSGGQSMVVPFEVRADAAN